MTGPIFLLGVPKASTTSLHEWVCQLTGRTDFGLKEAGVLLDPEFRTSLGRNPESVDSNPWAFYSQDAASRELLAGSQLLIVSLRNPIGRTRSMLRDQQRGMRLVSDPLAEVHGRGISATDVAEQSRYWKFWPLWSEAAAAGRLVVFDASADHGPQLEAIGIRLGYDVSQIPMALLHLNPASSGAVRPIQAVLRISTSALSSSRLAQRVWASHRYRLLSWSERLGSLSVPAPGLLQRKIEREVSDADLETALESENWREFADSVRPYWAAEEPEWLLDLARS